MIQFYEYFILACCYFILIAVIFRLFFTNRKKSSIKLLSRISMKRRLKIYNGGKD